MDTVRTGLIAAMLALALGGCGNYPLRESQLETALPEKTAQIVVGQTDRAAVRQLLGDPWLASRYWGFDLYRASDKNSQIIFYMFPMGFASEDVNGFVLVAYGADALVVEYERGIALDSGIFFDPSVSVGAELRAGDAYFQTAADGREAYVSVAVAARERYLRDVSVGPQCRVMLGCPQAYCPARVAIDGGPALEFSTGLTSYQAGSGSSAVAVVSLSPGKHRVEAAPAQRAEFSAAAMEFTCEAGEVLYVALRLELDPIQGKFSFKRRYTAALEVSPLEPEEFWDRPLLIWANGHWLVEEEPGR